jgi:enediyne biosynthesis protein E4
LIDWCHARWMRLFSGSAEIVLLRSFASLLAICAGLATPCFAQSAPAFEDIAQKAGLTVPHISSPEKKYIVESMSGGAGFIDCDGDGKLDIVTVNGSNVDRYRKGGDLLITLYHQDANLHFTDITKSAGLIRKGFGMGVAVADYDNDGRPDIFVTGFGDNVLYRNLGSCKFEDVTAKVGLRGRGFSAGAAWGDFDRDGHLDLFVARYVRLDMNHLPEFGSKQASCTVMNMPVQCGPLGLPGETDLLYHNRGNGTFEEISKKAHVDNPGGAYGMQPLWFDYDGDGWPDLYVANDTGANYLYHNKHDGTFEDVSLLSGTALDNNGKQRGSMGVDAEDFDHSGQLSLFVSTYAFQPDALYLNHGEGAFEDIGASAGIGGVTYPYVGWGAGLVDFTNSGWDDAFVTNGHVFPQADSMPGSAPYHQPIQLFHNNGNRTFTDISKTLKLPLLSRRGAAFGDVNNDGKVDVLILNEDGPPTLLLNRTPTSNHAVLIGLEGTKSNRSGIGARVTVRAGGMVQFQEERGGGSYLSSNDPRLHFGLGATKTIDSVEIAWPSGKKESFSHLPADFIYTFAEGRGVAKKVALGGS